jgi:hypothetical protein
MRSQGAEIMEEQGVVPGNVGSRDDAAGDGAGPDGFTEEEVREQAANNAAVWPLAFLAYAREQGQGAEEATRSFGRLIAPSWDEEQGTGARSALRWVALNAVAGGAELVRLEGDAARAEAVLGGGPGADDLAFFGLSRAEADAFHAYMHPVAERLGLRFGWQRTGDEVVLSLEQA